MTQECHEGATPVGGWWLARTNPAPGVANRRSVCFVCGDVFAELVNKGRQSPDEDDCRLWTRYRVLRSLGGQDGSTARSQDLAHK